MARLPVVGPKPRPGDKKKREALMELYADLPALECKQLCSASCGPVVMTRLEWQQVCRAAGRETQGGADLVCPLLEAGRCSVYEVRPILCRLWGVVETMKCPWGCRPERYLTEEEGFEFMVRVAELS